MLFNSIQRRVEASSNPYFSFFFNIWFVNVIKFQLPPINNLEDCILLSIFI